MYCTNCGQALGDGHRFCAHCGTAAPQMPVGDTPPSIPPQTIDPAIDWRNSMNVGEILNHPDVRARIVRVTGATPQGMTAEQFFKYAEPLMAAAGAGGIPLAAIKDIALPLYSRLGLKMDRELSQGFRNTFGETLAAVLCSLASRSQPLVDISEAGDGCILNSRMASSIWSWEGNMIITLERRPEGTMMKATITVPGQSFDWGRSKRVLQDLIEDVKRYRD
ncbi:MAG: zinc ribbon domain-containing protein [Pseudomonadota bacterium]|jgi:hypothetical protein|nr:zinc ribbon domain-containing protein [Pseudomonadota bacterium]